MIGNSRPPNVDICTQAAKQDIADLKSRLEKGVSVPAHTVKDAVDSTNKLFYSVVQCLHDSHGPAALAEARSLLFELEPLVPHECEQQRKKVESLLDLCERIQA
jgi:hypothetical protein